MSLKPINLKLSEKFADPEYFHEYFAGRAQDEVASGIRDLREVRGMKQGDLAVAAEMKQSAVSRIEGAEYSGWTFNSLRRIARALDARLSIFFEPREAVIARYQTQELATVGLKIVGATSSVTVVRYSEISSPRIPSNATMESETSHG